MAIKCRNEKRFFQVLFLFLAIFMTAYVLVKDNIYSEPDSYVLPAVSIQYRGTFLITQEDIDQARKDFPDLYQHVYTWEDLRTSKLLQVDSEHWMAFYFPSYALLSLPVKLLLQFLRLNQSNAFVITNVLLAVFALYCFFLVFKKRLGFFHASLWTLLLFASPLILYCRYISAECTLFSLVLLSMTLWYENKYKRAGLLISIASTMNPTAMGIGIFLFIDYALSCIKNNKGCLLKKDNMLDVLKMTGCYIPSLIPFFINLRYFGVWYPSSDLASTEGLFTRFLAYIFDLNLGLASISILLVLLFVVSIIYNIYRKEWKSLIKCGSVLFTVLLFSITFHINSGMLNCARYVIWIYPAFVLVIADTVHFMLSNQKVIHGAVLSLCFAFQLILLAFNGFYGPREFNNFSKLILNNYPQIYINIYPATFNCRVNDIDGAYIIDEPVIYVSEKDGAVRKILFFNDENNCFRLLNKISSLEDTDLTKLKDKLNLFDKKRYYYINIDKNEKIQYYLKE